MHQDPTPTEEFSLFETDFEYLRASTGKRFLNFLIDLVVYYMLTFVVGFIAASLYPPIAFYLVEEQQQGFSIVLSLLALVIFVLYMTITEAFLSGRSIGKLITNTRAVNLDGTRISFKTALLRSLSRAVPFSAFSALGAPCDPWWDQWTKTLVIDQKKAQ
ncbi:RDD family protein [Niabella sp.]|uniref:RDD family protein n=1 Tax=Niabella sp. TaxID=1962976 RepID=UPI0026083826|nr:RDD family protein [Niabella sp.]